MESFDEIQRNPISDFLMINFCDIKGNTKADIEKMLDTNNDSSLLFTARTGNCTNVPNKLI